MKDFPNKGKGFLIRADAIGYAYRLLKYRDRSESELTERLRKKGFSEDAVKEAVSRLKEKGLINDASLALSLKRSAEDVRLLGSRGVRLFLRHRGIAEEIINDISLENEAEEALRAKKLVDRKLRTMRNYSDDEIKKKIWRFMVGKGYLFDTIRQVIRQLRIKEEEE